MGRMVADIIVPRGIENKVAISMVSDQILKTLHQKSRLHQLELKRLGQVAENNPLSRNVIIVQHTNQIRGINTLLMNPEIDREDFIFYFDRLAVMLVCATNPSSLIPPSLGDSTAACNLTVSLPR